MPLLSFSLNRTILHRNVVQKIPEFKLLTNYVRRKNLHATMINNLTNSTRGVSVLWSPADSGKSTTSYHVVNELISSNRFRGVVYTKGNHNKSLEKWIDSITPNNKSISDVLQPGPPLLIYADHVEDMIKSNSDLEYIKKLAQESVDTKLFSVFLSTNCVSTAQSILELNGARKIQAIGSYDGPCFDIHVDDAFAVAIAYKEIRQMQLKDSHLKIISEAAVMAKSYGTIINALSGLPIENQLLTSTQINRIQSESDVQCKKWTEVRDNFRNFYPL